MLALLVSVPHVLFKTCGLREDCGCTYYSPWKIHEIHANPSTQNLSHLTHAASPGWCYLLKDTSNSNSHGTRWGGQVMFKGKDRKKLHACYEVDKYSWCFFHGILQFIEWWVDDVLLFVYFGFRFEAPDTRPVSSMIHDESALELFAGSRRRKKRWTRNTNQNIFTTRIFWRVEPSYYSPKAAKINETT